MQDHAMEQIEQALALYFDGIHNGDIDRLKAVFASKANLYSASDGSLTVMPLADYLGMVAGRPSPASGGHDPAGRVVSVDVSGPNSAVAKVEVEVPPKRFVDILSLLRIDGTWRIISKVYHTVT